MEDKSIYELKRFKSSKEKELIKALKLYSDNIEPVDRTNTNEILYWVDNYNLKYKDTFYVFGFYLNNCLIGFCELMHFVEENIVLVDYLVIDKVYRRNNTFYEFIFKIQNYMHSKGCTIDYVVAEVGCFLDEQLQPSQSSRNLIRLLKMNHFGVVKVNYFVPRLGLKNPESEKNEIKAILMILSNHEVKQLKKESFMLIIDVIHRYYMRWYTEFYSIEEKDEYCKILKALHDKIEKEVIKKYFIEINGYQDLFPLPDYITKEPKSRVIIKLILFILVLILCTLLIGTLSLIIQKRIGIDISGQSTILTISLIIVALIFTFKFERKSNFFTGILEKFIDKF